MCLMKINAVNWWGRVGVSLLLLILSGISLAAEVKCNIEAYIVASDNHPVVMRDKPKSSSKIVGRLQADDMVVIDRQAPGFYRIKAVLAVADEKALEQGRYSPIRGWVSRDGVGVGIRSGEVYAKGDANRVIDQTGLDASAKLISCREDWAEIRYQVTPDAAEKSGWLPPFAQCGNSLTTCP